MNIFSFGSNLLLKSLGSLCFLLGKANLVLYSIIHSTFIELLQCARSHTRKQEQKGTIAIGTYFIASWQYSESKLKCVFYIIAVGHSCQESKCIISLSSIYLSSIYLSLSIYIRYSLENTLLYVQPKSMTMEAKEPHLNQQEWHSAVMPLKSTENRLEENSRTLLHIQMH